MVIKLGKSEKLEGPKTKGGLEAKNTKSLQSFQSYLEIRTSYQKIV